MNTDIRLLVSFKGHRKRKRLKRMLGPGATDYLIDLWISAAMDRPSGVLTGWDEVDIADAADWPEDKDPQILFDALVKCGWFELDDAGKPVKPYTLNDWPEHQGHVVGATDRSNKARINAFIKNYGKAAGLQKSIEFGIDVSQYGYDPAISSAGSTANSRANQHANSSAAQHAPSPSPSPSPSLKQTAPPGQPSADPSQNKKSRHFKNQVNTWFSAIITSCKKLDELSAANGKKFNPYQWVQSKANQRGHPGAIDESLSGLINMWDAADRPWAYIEQIFKTKNGNWNERDAIKIHEQFKQLSSGQLSEFTYGLLKEI